MSGNQHTGSCFCGSVEVTATGAPVAMGYCHCKDCRAWSATPVTEFTLWRNTDVKIEKGAELLGSFSQSGASHRKFCTKCGGNMMVEIPEVGITDVFAAILPTLDFQPGVHVNYENATIKMRDGLPKMKDFPQDMGGSGETLPE